MRKRLALPLTVLALFGLMAAFASSAQAHPSYGRCSDCHSGANVPVTATLATTVGTTATYNVSSPGATAIAVFDGAANKIGSAIIGSSGSFAVPVGATYTVYSVKGPSTNTGRGSTTVSPAPLPPADTTAPTTTSDAVASYLNSATIHLTAADNAGGSGVAHTYYILDSSPQAEGTTISTNVVGPHTIQFWSVDTASNTETPHKTASFTVRTPVPDTTAPTTTSDAVASYAYTASIHLTATDNAGGSGVAHTYYILDSNPQAEGTSVGTGIAGPHTLQFWSVDTSANVETPRKSAAFTVVPDLTAPVTTSNAKTTYFGPAIVKLTATDAGGSGVAHTYYVLDNGTQTEGTTVSAPTLGAHTVEFWSTDGANNVEAPHGTASFEVTAPLTPPTPVYRFYNKRNHTHFYTASEAEKNRVLVRFSSIYRLEGVAFTIDSTNPDNSAPLYRFYDRGNHSHFYTASESEKNDLIATESDDYVYDGPAFNVSANPVPGATTVYRFYNKRNGSHFYTASEAEKANVINTLSESFRLEGPAYYIAK